MKDFVLFNVVFSIVNYTDNEWFTVKNKEFNFLVWNAYRIRPDFLQSKGEYQNIQIIE